MRIAGVFEVLGVREPERPEVVDREAFRLGIRLEEGARTQPLLILLQRRNGALTSVRCTSPILVRMRVYAWALRCCTRCRGVRACVGEQVDHPEPERRDDLLDGAARVAVEKDPSGVALGDRERRVPILVRGTAGEPPAAVALHAVEPSEKLVGVHANRPPASGT